MIGGSAAPVVVRNGGSGADPSPSPRRLQTPVVQAGPQEAFPPMATAASSSSFVRSSSISPLRVDVDVPVIGSLDIFSRFHGKRGDLSAVVMAPEESSCANPISEDVLEKLRKRQAMLNRGGAERSTEKPKQAPVPAALGAVAGPRRPSITPSSSSASSINGDEDDIIFEDALGRDGGEGETSGFGVGENFFSFAPKETKPGHHKTLTAESLQATVVVPNNKKNVISTFTKQAQIQQQRRQPTTSNQQDVRRIVPLWSVERMNLLGGYCSDNARVALHQEIMDLVEYLKPSQAEVSMRRYIELQVADLARTLFPGCDPVVYGSMTTHLVLPLSDLDMSILNVNVPIDDALNQLARAIANAGLCVTAYPQVILKTKVPLLKFKHKGSLLDVDVSINAGDGKHNSEIVRELLKKFPEARHLTIVIKYFLQQRDMHEPYKGGLGSYATVILVISFLQHHPIYTTQIADRGKTGLGKLLVDFFRYYGHRFNYNRCGVSIENGGFYFMRKTPGSSSSMESFGRGPLGPPQLVVEDPGNPDNNATSSLRIFPAIASTFDHAYIALTGEFELAGRLEDMTPDSPLVSMRPTLLSRILHVDAESVVRRQAIISCYQELLAENLDHFHHVVHGHRANEDAAMIRLRSSLAAHVEGLPQPAQQDEEEEGDREPAAAVGRKHHRSSGGSGHAASSSPEAEGGSHKRRRREGR